MAEVYAETPASRRVYLGVLINPNNISRFTRLAGYRVEASNTAKTRIDPVLYFFMLQDIDYSKRTIKGLFFDPEQNRWEKQAFPFPDVIYLRKIPDPQDQRLESFLLLAGAMRIPLVNSLPAFNKWEVHQVLSGSHIKAHLPQTRLYSKHAGDLTTFLRRYGKVYLKACLGSRGREVMQVIQLPGGYLEYSYFNGKLYSCKIDGSRLPSIAGSFFKGRDFIIQQPVDLINFSGKKVDLRAEVQRNGRGELEVVAIPVRVGNERSPITTHGSCYRFSDFFGNLLNLKRSSVDELEKKLHVMLFGIYEVLEKRYGPFGEMGIDIGLDKEYRLWFIESNSQSARVSLTNAYNGSTVRKAYTNPLEYALYIACSRR